MNKKAQIEQIGTLVVPLVAAAIVLAIGFLIFAEVKDQAISSGETQSHSNATISITADAFGIINSSCVYERDISVSEVYNDSAQQTGGGNANGTSILTNHAGAAVQNYTVSGQNINVSNDALGDLGGLGSSVFITYSCTKPTYAINGTRNVQNATDTIPQWFAIIVITIIGGILIGLVGIFRRRQ